MSSDSTDHIDDYLADSLSPPDREAFERELERDPDLRAEVALQKRINAEAALRADDDRHRALIRNARNKYGTTRPANPGAHRRWWLMAAAAVVLALAIFILRPWPESPRQMAARYGAKNKPADYLPLSYRQIRSGGTSGKARSDSTDPIGYARTLVQIDTLPEVALRAYLRIPESTRNDSLRFEIALLYLQTQQPRLALNILTDLEADFQGGRRWYRALAHLQLGDRAQARAEVRRLVEGDDFSPYQKDALDLLEDLGRP